MPSSSTIQKNGENIVANINEQSQVAANNNAVAEQPKNDEKVELVILILG